ncbi:hypothetical protein BC943DRAFT_360351 [Umbelopsis sp. AD052]|nr:hypothetical protein BC943DRAFT_360351 [Umbelopsis sp. AD052]
MVTSTCCCCIPLRVGVGIIATLSLAFYGSSLILCFVYKNGNVVDNRINGVNAIFWSSVAVSIVWLLASLFGLIGVLTQRRGMVLLFNTFNWIMAFLTLGVSLAAFILLLAKQQDAHNNCVTFWNEQGGPPTADGSPYHSSVNIPSNQQSIDDYCTNVLRILTIVIGVLTFVGNGIQLYFAAMVGAYSTRLKRFRQHVPLRDLDYMQDKQYTSPYPAPY